ncbi:mitogen-activated protein kinase kinase kinase 17-like [Lolium rigidum]|uniref:mitogen-activated protein kinase kinase kinase 17-like n=1 Tax=Lolium rigidum TaxID=89674 RepID=UPI001F5C0BD1|nr:mitogen-activated protein kinase kinase kinase 17-like [Lolium rigidum]
MDPTMAKQLRRLRTLGRGASGAVVWLASDDASGQLLAVKSAGADAAETLRREGRLLAGLRSPHILPCLGSRAGPGGEHQLLLEFAPRGSLADEAARSGGRLAERAIRGHASDVARGLAYLHARALVHGDVKSRNVVVGADGRAKLADFGCARTRGCERPIGGTPAFMAPEVARGEEQGPAADVWALGCTVIEMATGRAPWGDVDDVFAAVHRIGFTDAVPELPGWLSPEANDFLGKCLARNSSHRSTAAQLMEHPFLASASLDVEEETPAKKDWVISPKSTLNPDFGESDEEDETEEDNHKSATDRIFSLASPSSALPDWDSDDGWIDVHSQRSEASETTTATVIAGPWSETLEPEADVDGSTYLVRNVEAAHYLAAYETCLSLNVAGDQPFAPIASHRCKIVKFVCHCYRERLINFDFAQTVFFVGLPFAR